jgi:hypothetical protein
MSAAEALYLSHLKPLCSEFEVIVKAAGDLGARSVIEALTCEMSVL